MPSFSAKSAEKLKTCSQALQDLFNSVIKQVDCTIMYGLRGKSEQDKLFKDNASKVKWPDSKHNGTAPDYNVSDAVDASPYPVPKGWGEINGATRSELSIGWKERVKFYMFAGIVKYQWALLQSKTKEYRDMELVWGGDWDNDNDFNDNKFDDLVHFQIVKKKKRPNSATFTIKKSEDTEVE